MEKRNKNERVKVTAKKKDKKIYKVQLARKCQTSRRRRRKKRIRINKLLSKDTRAPLQPEVIRHRERRIEKQKTITTQ